MDTSLVIGLVVFVVVGFFAYQWWSKSGRRLTGGTRRVAAAATPAPMKEAAGTGGAGVPGNVLAAAAAAAETAGSMRSEPPAEGRYPQVPGQTEAEMRAPEPLQRRDAAAPPPQLPVGHEGHAPAQFESNLRHPEKMFHQPQGQQAVPTMTVSDVPGGRAAAQSTPLSGNQQAFSPEMAQNGGALVGNTLFAYDGMEPTGFAAF